jgi:hypothetical protein
MHQQPFSFPCFMALPVTVPQWQLAHSILAFSGSGGKCPPGTQGTQIDIEAGYHCLKMLMTHIPFMAVAVREGIIIDLFHPFSLHSAGRNLGEALDATLDVIMQWLSVTFIAKWVDDIIPIHIPISGWMESGWMYRVSLAQILDEMQRFGWPINPLKLVDFSSVVKYIGFCWDLEVKIVSLPE